MTAPVPTWTLRRPDGLYALISDDAPPFVLDAMRAMCGGRLEATGETISDAVPPAYMDPSQTPRPATVWRIPNPPPRLHG